MKTAVSVPDRIFEAAEQLAKRLRVSRSELYTKAIETFVAAERGRGVTELLNEVYGPNGEGSDLEPTVAELQRRSIPLKRPRRLPPRKTR